MIHMGQAEVASLRTLAGLATPMALRVAVTLGLPDRLRDRAATAAELATELTVSPVALELLLQHLVSLEVAEHTSAGYRTSDYGANLCSDADNMLTNLLHFDCAGGRAELAFVELAHSITTGQAAYARRYGQDFWADLAQHPHLQESFDWQMTRRFRDDIPTIATGYDWARFATIVDVGGGHGTLLAAILTVYPRLRGQLIDLELTATEAARTFAAHGLGDRAQAIPGSFFDPLPAGAAAYLLFDILHDWDDERAHLILRRCTEAANPTSRILVVEAVGGHLAVSGFNLAMLAMYGGRDRTLDEFRELTAPHGLTLANVTDLTDQRSLLEFAWAAS